MESKDKIEEEAEVGSEETSDMQRTVEVRVTKGSVDDDDGQEDDLEDSELEDQVFETASRPWLGSMVSRSLSPLAAAESLEDYDLPPQIMICRRSSATFISIPRMLQQHQRPPLERCDTAHAVTGDRVGIMRQKAGLLRKGQAIGGLEGSLSSPRNSADLASLLTPVNRRTSLALPFPSRLSVDPDNRLSRSHDDISVHYAQQKFQRRTSSPLRTLRRSFAHNHRRSGVGLFQPSFSLDMSYEQTEDDEDSHDEDRDVASPIHRVQLRERRRSSATMFHRQSSGVTLCVPLQQHSLNVSPAETEEEDETSTADELSPYPSSADVIQHHSPGTSLFFPSKPQDVSDQDPIIHSTDNYQYAHELSRSHIDADEDEPDGAVMTDDIEGSGSLQDALSVEDEEEVPSPGRRLQKKGSIAIPLERCLDRTKLSHLTREQLQRFLANIKFISSTRFSESYFAVKGAALILPQSECPRTITRGSHGGDIQTHLQSMFYLLRPPDTIKVAVKLESISPTRNRYMAVVSTVGRQDTEESVILGIDIETDKATIGLVLPIWGDTSITLDGDGGFKVTSNERLHIFKPVSVQAMWSALQSVIKARDTANHHSYYPGGLTHTWVQYYEVHITSDQPALNEWNTMEDIESHRPSDLTPQESLEKVELEKLIKIKLKEIMLTVDLEEVTSKYLRTRLEEEMGMGLKDMRHFIDEEMIVIMRQMDSPSEIFPFLFLGSEWNASNLDELQQNGVNHILNVTREIDNFFPGLFDYSNIRVYDIETAELLKHWDNTYKFIKKAESMNSKVLVHCKMGVSRSASSVIAFAMKEYGWSLQEAHDHVKKKRSCIRPNKGFWSQLVTYEGILDASKQRNSKLWRSKSAGDLSEQACSERLVQEEDRNLLVELLDYSGYPTESGSRPRSWSPEDSTTQILMKTHNLASDESSDDEMQMNCSEVNAMQRDYEGPNAPPFLCWDDLDDLSSHSMDSMMDIVHDESSVKQTYDRRSQPRVVLLSYRAFSGSEGDHANMSDGNEALTEESDLDDIVAEECSGKVQRGFYDVQMLTADLLGPEALGTDEEMPTNHINYYLHPDYKMDLLFAQQRKHRRIAQLLKLSQPPDDFGTLHATQVVESSKPQVPTIVPQVTKLRADNSWIKEIPPCLQDPNKIGEPTLEEEDGVIAESPSSPEEQALESKAEVNPLDISPVEIKSEPLTSEFSSDTPPHIQSSSEEERLQCSGDADDSDTSAGGGAPHDIGVVQHYQKEDIPWNPGTVKRHKHDLEQRLKTKSKGGDQTSSSSSDESGSSESLNEIQIIETPPDDRPMELTLMLSGVEVGETSTDDPLTTTSEMTTTTSKFPVSSEGGITSNADVMPESATDRPTSIYEIEAIDVEPGVVQRTKQEIEKRGSISSQEFDAELKTVQRSASMKEEKLRSKKDRSSERRRTCTPVMRTPSSEPDLTDECTGGETAEGAECTVMQIGLETVEVVEGKVKKHKRAIESRTSKSEGDTSDATTVTSPESTADTTSSLSPEAISKQGGLTLPLEAPSEGDIPQGAVWKQKRELESRFGGSAGCKEPSPSLDLSKGSTVRTSPDNLGPEVRTLSRKSPTTSVGGAYRCGSGGAGCGAEGGRDVKSEKSTSAMLSVGLSGKASMTVSSTSDQKQYPNKPARSVGSPEESQGVEVALKNSDGVEVERKAEARMSAYAKENIPWSLGTVRQQKEAIEKVNTAGVLDSRRSSSKSPTWCEGDVVVSPPGCEMEFGIGGGLHRASSCKTFSTAGSVMDACMVGRSASFKEGTHTRTELKVSLSKPVNAPVHISQKDIVISKVGNTGQEKSIASASVAGKVVSKIPLPLEAELERWSSKKEVLIVEALRAEVKSVESDETVSSGKNEVAQPTTTAEKLSKPIMKPIEEKTVRDLVGIFDSAKSKDKKSSPSDEQPDDAATSSKKTFAVATDTVANQTLSQESQTTCRSKSVTVRPETDSKACTERALQDRKISLPAYLQSPQVSTQGGSGVKASLEAASSDYSPTMDRRNISTATTVALGTHRIPMSTHREPDPEGVPRKSRKLHGKSHPLTKLTMAGQAP